MGIENLFLPGEIGQIQVKNRIINIHDTSKLCYIILPIVFVNNRTFGGIL